MERLIWNEEIECMPLPQLVELCQKNFRELKIMDRAAHSALYREKWAAVGVVPGEVRTYADLRNVPYTSGGELREAQARYHPDELVSGDNVRLWGSTSGTTGVPKWIPVGERSLSYFTEALYRQMSLMIGVTRDWSMMVLMPMAPFFGDAGVYHMVVSQMLAGMHAEFTIVDLPETFDALNFARLAQPEGIFAMPSMAMVVAEGVSAQAAEGARQQFKKERTLRNLVAVLVTSVVKIKAKNVFKFKWALFGGEPVGPYRSALYDAYGLEPFAIYGATEFRSPPTTECTAHNGLHIYLDLCLPEIIPQVELEKEGADASYVPQAIPIWEASPGLTGELVLTNFVEALPLVRYRMSDLAEVVSTEPCACGRTHPRIKVLCRSDDIVNLGLIRFSIYQLKEKMEAVAEHGQVGKWQLRITREDYKPKALLLVEPQGEVAKEPFVKEIRDKVDELEGVRQAWENGLIAEPEVRLVEELIEERTATGKIRLAIYEDVYFKET